MIEFYKEFGDLGYLANYSNHGFTIDNIYYKTVEHYYQAMKYEDKEIREKIINAETPKEASNIGRDRNNKRIDNFKKIKDDIMYNGILEKFRQNRDIAFKLIETRNQEIAEATVDEYYWGIGKDRTGENHIGKILVKVRDRIKKEILDSIINKAKKEDVVYVIGHKRPDADSYFSSILLARVLRSLGINAKAALLDKDYEVISSEKELINDYKIDELEIINNSNKFILVDHNNLEGLSSDNVLGAIDHHIISGEVYDTLEIEYASTGLLIYDLFKDIYKFNKEERLLIYLTVLTDTEYLCSSRFTLEDRKLFDKLKIKEDVNELQRKYFVTTDFSKDIDVNLKENYKEYKREGLDIFRSLITSYNKEYSDYYKDYKKYVWDKENYLLIWVDYELKQTHVIFNKREINYDYVISSTNLILKELLK